MDSLTKLFCLIDDISGVPMRSFDIAVKYIEGTETTTGLKVRAGLTRGGNKIGERVSNEEVRLLGIEPHAICPAWSYRIHPCPEPAPNNQFIYC